MNNIVLSSCDVDAHVQNDGSKFVVENHMDAEGVIYTYRYFCPENVQPETVRVERVKVLNKELENVFLAKQLVSGTLLPFSKLKFRELFTFTERCLIDEFHASFESNPGLTVDHKRSIRTGLEDYKMAQHVARPFDSRVEMMLNMYVQLGILSVNRKNEIMLQGNGGN